MTPFTSLWEQAVEHALFQAVSDILQRGVTVSQEHTTSRLDRARWIQVWAWKTASLDLPIELRPDASTDVQAVLEVIQAARDPSCPAQEADWSWLEAVAQTIVEYIEHPSECVWLSWAMLVYVTRLAHRSDGPDGPAPEVAP